MEYKLYPKQQAFINATDPTLWFCGGVSSGKSVVGGAFALKCIKERPTEVGLIFANTNKQLQLATLHKFKNILNSFGLIEEADYVVNKNPQPYFHYESKFNEHPGIWSFKNGAQIMTFSLESSLEGIEAGWCWGDEAQDATETQITTIFARMRGSAHPLKRFTLTPPEYNKYIDSIVFDVKQSVIRATTYDNSHNLPAGFIEGLKSVYDKRTFDRQVLGKKVALVNNRFAYALDDEQICNEFFVSGLEWKKNLPIYLSFDFNKAPLTCIAAQMWGNNIQILREFRSVGVNLQTLCQEIAAVYGFSNFYITGDATGLHGDNITQDKFRHYYKIIEGLLRVPEANFTVPPGNPRHQSTRLQLNSLIENEPLFVIDKEKCPYLVDDLMYVEALPDGSIDKDKDKRLTHLIDCLRYLLWNFVPERRAEYVPIR